MCSASQSNLGNGGASYQGSGILTFEKVQKNLKWLDASMMSKFDVRRQILTWEVKFDLFSELSGILNLALLRFEH